MRFIREESGGATVEWVVLTALVVALASMMFDEVGDEVLVIAGHIESTLASLPIPTSFAEFTSLGA